MTSDFIELDYTGSVEGVVFDTTRKEDAPKGSKGPFGPVVVKLGIGQLLPGLDEFLIGKKTGSYELTLPTEKAFGKKDAKLLKLVPLSTFGKEANKLEPGIPVRIGEQTGAVKSISGGRVVVDFNHPLAGKDVHYTLHVAGIVTDNKKKVDSIIKAMLGVQLPVTEDKGAITVTIPKGFPSEGFNKEIEKQTGVSVLFKEVEIKQNQHVHADGSVHDNDHHHSH